MANIHYKIVNNTIMEFYDNVVAFKKDDRYWLITMENNSLTINVLSSYAGRLHNRINKNSGCVTKSQFKIEELFKLISDFIENTLDLNIYSIELIDDNISITDKVNNYHIIIELYHAYDTNALLLETCKNAIITKNLSREVALLKNQVALLKDQVATFNDIRNMMNSFMELK